MPGPRQVDVPRVLHISSGALGDLSGLLVENFDTDDVMVVSGAKASWEHGESVTSALRSQGCQVREFRDPGGSTADVTQLVELLDQQRPTLVVAFGGGRPIDVAKLAASRTKVDLVVVPTVLSHDGMCSPVASLVAGDDRRRSLPAATPAGVIVDSAIVAAAPARYLRAGVGDLMSNVTAVTDWRAAAADGDGPVDELAASMALTAALSVLEIAWPPTEHDVETVARALVMSGLAMEIAGSSRPCSGSDHLISHALDELFPSAGSLHGDQVALGTVVAAHVQGNLDGPRIRALFDRMGYPSDLLDWGWSRDQLVAAVAHAPTTRPDRVTSLGRRLAETSAADLVDSLL